MWTPAKIGELPTKKLLTLFGEVEWRRSYYQCQVEADKEANGEQEQAQKCSHGRIPADERWGVQGTRTTPGVQQYISYLCAMLTLEEAAETFRRQLPLRMFARQALNLMKPVGRALAQKEDEEVKALFEEATKSQTQEEEKASRQSSKDIERLSIELDGILARMRRGSVPMEEDERKRKGDVYREMKVGAVFLAQRGPERSELVPDVWVDMRHPKTVCATSLGARPRAALASCSMRWLSSLGSAEPSRSSR